MPVVIENVEVEPAPPPAPAGAPGSSGGSGAGSPLERAAELTRAIRHGAQRLSRVRAH